MTYDFDQIISRRNTGSLKWDVAEHELPMWVADMDFQTAPEVRAAFEKRIAHGIFGYSDVTDEWYDAYISWWDRRHHMKMSKDWLIFCTGIVPAISSIVRKLTTPNENVLIQTPVYNIFFNSIMNNGCRVLESELVYENGAYSINFVDLEEKLANPQTTLMILCNPHNPVGKIWDKETLEKIGDLCVKHAVTVISDEIHCDLTDPGFEYIPFASVSKNCKMCSITCIAPTKCFNIAGLQTACVSVPNPVLRHKVWRGLNTDEVAEPNAFAVIAAISAFNEGEAWLNALNEYIYENKKTVLDFVSKEIKGLYIVPSNATYLLWLDISKTGLSSEEVASSIRKKTGLYLTAGEEYGKSGDQFLRMNIACPRETLLDGLNRLKEGLCPFV